MIHYFFARDESNFYTCTYFIYTYVICINRLYVLYVLTEVQRENVEMREKERKGHANTTCILL